MARKILGLSLPVAAVAAIGAYLLYKKSQTPAPAKPVSGLGYMPNTTLSYGPLYGDVVLDNSTMPGMGDLGFGFKSITKKIKKVAKKVAAKSPGLKVVKAVAKVVAKSPVAKVLNATPVGKLVNKSPIAKMIAPKAKPLTAAQKAARLTVMSAVAVPVVSPNADSSGESYTDVVYTGNDQGTDYSGQSFSDPNITYSGDESGGDQTERFDAAPSGSEQDAATDDGASDEAAPAAGGGAKMAMAAAAAAGAFILFKRH